MHTEVATYMDRYRDINFPFPFIYIIVKLCDIYTLKLVSNTSYVREADGCLLDSLVSVQV
jgi:hypothetical protein